MRLLTLIKSKYHNTLLADLWRRIAPSFVVKKTFFGQTVFMDFRDNIDEFSRSTAELETREERALNIPLCTDGVLWDVGANVGLFSVRAASAGHSCVAFEFSKKASQLLRKTVLAGRLPVTVVERAFSTTPQRYNPVQTSGPQNQVDFLIGGAAVSITYKEAEELYGTPAVIKMDIEGGEKDFFDSCDFKVWFCERKIFWLVELHPSILGYVPKWGDVPCFQMDELHHLYCNDPDQLNSLIEKINGM